MRNYPPETVERALAAWLRLGSAEAAERETGIPAGTLRVHKHWSFYACWAKTRSLPWRMITASERGYPWNSGVRSSGSTSTFLGTGRSRPKHAVHSAFFRGPRSSAHR